MAEIIDGRKIAGIIQSELKERVKKLTDNGIIPQLATILVGEDPASLSYLRKIRDSFIAVGVHVKELRLPRDIGQEELERTIVEINQDPRIHGILIQMPLPGHIDVTRLSEIVDPRKDVDCINPLNMGLFLMGNPRFIPCTPLAVYELLRRSGYDLRGKEVVVVGAAGRVGRVLTLLLIRKWATVTACDIATHNLAEHTKNADILISVVGKPHLITADAVKEGAVVIDVGLSRIEDPERPGKLKLVGDVDFDAVKEKAGAITPVPGGVGPVTTAMLISNTIKATEILYGLSS